MSSTYSDLWEQVIKALSGLLAMPVTAGPQDPEVLAADRLLGTLAQTRVPPAVAAQTRVFELQFNDKVCARVPNIPRQLLEMKQYSSSWALCLIANEEVAPSHTIIRAQKVYQECLEGNGSAPLVLSVFAPGGLGCRNGLGVLLVI